LFLTEVTVLPEGDKGFLLLIIFTWKKIANSLECTFKINKKVNTAEAAEGVAQAFLFPAFLLCVYSAAVLT